MRDYKEVQAEQAGALLTVDLRALQNNWRHLADLAGSAKCGAAVKADCYGLGLEPVVTALAEAGCETFFVALPLEGKEVRAVLPGADIFVLAGLLPGQAAFYHQHKLQPVLCTPTQVDEWQAFCRRKELKLPAGLHIETGINRLGLTARQTRELAGQRDVLSAFRLTLVISHLACGDMPGDAMNIEQRDKFNQLRALLPDAPASLANSPGTFLGEEFTYDLVRPGIALYGGNPFGNRANPMSTVVRLYAPLLQVRQICTGESVGYGATWTAKRASRIGVIGAGYGDGLPRALSSPAKDGPACVFIGGNYAPIIGRVSMDLITVDLTDVPEEMAQEGQRIELIGDNVSVDDIARWAGTIPYEVLTGLGSRYARLYSPSDS
ncbi:MAG TPA: alanine racemase [Rhizobiales bacterium]|nr:alanine racemase [Hyphomicrobiales bacterium]